MQNKVLRLGKKENVTFFEAVTLNASRYCPSIDPRALEIMRQALEKISSIHKSSSDPAEKYEVEEMLEKLDFALITARNALDRALMPGECRN